MKYNEKVLKIVESQRSVIYFVVVVLLTHFLWKFLLHENEQATLITLLGWDISLPFNMVANHVAWVSHKVLNSIGFDTSLLSCNIVQHNTSQQSAQVVWGCTGIKQGYIFFCLIAFYRGSWRDKLWYIPAGLLVIYLFNLLRIALIVAILDKHPHQFELWHEYITKYLFYLLIFGMWVVWDERYVAIRKTK